MSFNNRNGRGGEPSWRGNSRGGGGGGSGGFRRQDHNYDKRQKWGQEVSVSDQVKVLTNFFDVSLQVSNRNASAIRGYYAYNIDVIAAVRPKTEDGAFHMVAKERISVESKNEEKIRAIVEQLKTNLWIQSQAVLASEGHQFGVSPHDLCDPAVHGHSAYQTKEQEIAERGVEQAVQPQTGPPTRDFYIRLPSDLIYFRSPHLDLCRDLVEHQKTSSWYIVRLTQLDFILFEDVEKVLRMHLPNVGKGTLIVKCIDTVVRSMMLSTLLAPGKSPRMFYLPPRDHIVKSEDTFSLLDNLNAYFQPGNLKAEKTSYRPLVGIRQSTCYVNGKLLLGVDTGMAFFNKESRIIRQEDRVVVSPGVPVLERLGDGWRIAGEKISIPIVDSSAQKGVKDALAAIKFHVHYMLPRKKDGTVADVPMLQLFRNLKLRPPKKEKGKPDRMPESIFWVANDPNVYSFDWVNSEGETRHTSAYHYYLEKYGIKLQHPDLPLVGTFKGYFPVEFLYTALSKTKNANSDDQKKDALEFNDKFAGNKRIGHIKFVRNEVQKLVGSGSPSKNVLDAFNLSLSADPLAITAKVLTPPKLVFAEDQVRNPNRGSWNLRDVKFHSPSTLNSFAVVDLTARQCATDMVYKLFETMFQHGMKLPINFDLDRAVLKELTVCPRMTNGKDLQTLHAAVSQAIDKARSYFLSGVHKLGFRTLSTLLYETKVGSTDTCCAMGVGNKVGLMFNPRDENGKSDFNDPRWATHEVKVPSGETLKARCHFAVELAGTTIYLDPFDLTGTERNGYLGYYENDWQQVKPLGLAYKDSNGVVVAISNPELQTWIHLVDRSQIECPAVILVCLPTKATAPYIAIKYLSNAVFGVQSQCLVEESYFNQKGGGYLSNVALKLNTKLANSWSQARAWTSDSVRSVNDVPWLSEVPTLIIGLSISHSSSGHSVVVASACLDNFKLTDIQGGFMQMGHEVKVIAKSDVVPNGTMKELVMSLVCQFSRRELPGPALRLLFYRDGGSDSNFKKLTDEEFKGIKLACKEVNAVLNSGCPGCAAQTCTKHMPQVTYIVAQSDHGVRIVPSNGGAGTQNVPFGTCVDHTIVSSSDGNPNFLLIAQHGLKGTSRAVYYKVIQNENFEVPKHLQSSCTQLTPEVLQKLTFNMSFHYGTATKSVRHVPVVLYSKRLAEQVVGYLSYLRSADLHDKELVTEIKNSLGNFQSFDRTDRQLDIDIPMLRNGILPAFGPFEPGLANGVAQLTTDGDEKAYLCCSLRNPYRPHLAA